MTYNTISSEIENSILTLTLNRPEMLNAFTVEMADELIEAFTTASDDDDVGAIVVTGAGRAFCAGMDLSVTGNQFGLNEELEPTLQDLRDSVDRQELIDGVRDTGGRVVLAIYDCKKPVIAAINGAAIGIGATMTCAMDIRLVSETAKVGFVFNKIGLTPEACSSWFLPKIVGIQTALEWCYTGDILNADALEDERFARAIYKPDQLLAEAYKLAARIVKHSAVSVALTRQMMYRNSAQEHPGRAHEVDSLAMFYASQTSGREGIASFLEKRSPQFEDRASTGMPPFYPWWDS